MRYWLILLVYMTLIQSCGNSDKKELKEEVSSAQEVQILPEPENMDGEALFSTCKVCHGENGEGNKSLNAPALVNQEAWYIERQLNNFKNSIRGADTSDIHGSQMAVIAKTLTTDESVKEVVKHIRTLPVVKTKKTMDGDIQDGKDYYNAICGACHGPAAVGNELLNAPKLVGADDWYLFRQYNNFKSGIRGSHPDDTFGAQMRNIAIAITSEKELTDVLAYIQSLE